ncbi:MFS transporter [Coprococcus comes]|uniref:MFS transporter n=1 Tax=Coprococcus comes TaxID=410072 RepID=UPI001570194F|nr:MFS transporter [Coprococcus comes]NSC16246.1 MFS transporter [Coprococcus comes]NSC19403.1 MFS transporter [Coprococcus comes]NSC31652.1 MFS transporter [Coprococcus comes]NSC69228.1 MFS transporter [Coprococcus comes]NSC87649.1 MFS transporter [Coprococcus comes]
MEEKKYLKWYNKIGYGSGDIAGNVVYAFLTSFMMVYLTDSVGLAAGVVGTLIAVSKLFDGFTDIFFGSMIDKTHSKMGKAKPWMLYGYIGCAITLVCCFAVPVSLGTTAKYAWFFISYTLLNGVFYTANNIAYSALTSLITKNSKERVQMRSYRFIFAFSTSLLIQAITVGFVDKCGGDAAAWRTVAIIYAIIGLVVNTISALSVKELPEEELNEGEVKDDNEKYGMVQAFKLLVKNKYYMMICGTYILQQLYGAMIGAGIYYMTWVLKNKNLFGKFAWAVNIPLIIALIFTPTLVGKWKGMYKLNLRGYVLAVIGRALVVVAGYMGSVPLMMAFTALAALGQGPWQGDMNAVIASCSEYTYLTQGKRIDGTMYSCTSLGVKIGGGIGTAVVGWLLEFSGYIGTNATQPQSALDMMQFMYLWLPLIFDVLIMFVLSRMNVEDANKKLKAEKGIATDEVTDASDIN